MMISYTDDAFSAYHRKIKNCIKNENKSILILLLSGPMD